MRIRRPAEGARRARPARGVRCLALAALAATVLLPATGRGRSGAPTPAPDAPAAPLAAPVDVAAVCGGALLDGRGTPLGAGDRVALGAAPVAVRTGDDTRAWLVLPDDGSLFLGPRTHVRLGPALVALVAGSAELVSAGQPIAWRVGPDGPDGPDSPDDRAGRAGRTGVAPPASTVFLSADARPRLAGLERCRASRPLLPLSLAPIERPDPAAIARAADDFLGTFSPLAGGDVGDAVSSCGCVEPGGGGGASGDLGGGSTLPDIDRKKK